MSWSGLGSFWQTQCFSREQVSLEAQFRAWRCQATDANKDLQTILPDRPSISRSHWVIGASRYVVSALITAVHSGLPRREQGKIRKPRTCRYSGSFGFQDRGFRDVFYTEIISMLEGNLANRVEAGDRIWEAEDQHAAFVQNGLSKWADL